MGAFSALERGLAHPRRRDARDELRRIRELTRAIDTLQHELAELVTTLAPQLLTAEGKSRRDAIRCLKRHLARRIWRLLQPADGDATTSAPSPPPGRPARPTTIHCNTPYSRFSLA